MPNPSRTRRPQQGLEAEQGSAPAGAHALHFEGFSVLPAERRLLVDGQPVKIGARAFDLLLTLLAARDRVVSKDELFERVWQGLVVEENNLSVHISQLRKLCGPRVVATVPGRGYQFTASSIEAGPVGKRRSTDDAVAAAAANHAARGNMPSQLPAMIGREPELMEVREMLRTQRWVTISGAGGMGKTRLAEAVGLEASEHMPSWLVEFASVSDPRFVPNAVAQAIGVTMIDTTRPLDAIIAALHGKNALLVLDNCEHLAAAVASLCINLLRELPLLRVLVTSQEVLHGPDEVVYKLGPLGLPDPNNLAEAVETGSVRLLLARIQALSRHFEITPQNIGDAVVICTQLDGLPLAIELAAGRVPMLGLAGVRERLGELFRLLTGDSRVRLRRHQTLRAALDWSYQLLQPSEQALLRRLGTFAGSFGIDGVRQIAEDLNVDEWNVLDTLALLIDKSMVHVKGNDRPRYLMLETARAYALEQMVALDETHDALARHARATCRVCAMATARRDTQGIWDEIANIRAAFAWAMRNHETELAVGLVNHSSVVLALGGLVGEVVMRLAEVEPRVGEGLPRPLAAQFWQWLGRFGNDGRLPASHCVDALQKSEALFRQLGNDRHVHACLRMRAEALVEQGELDGAICAIAGARQIETAASPPADCMRRMRIEAKILERRGDFVAAIESLERALDMARRADINRYLATLTQDIGQCLLDAGDAKAAEARFRSVLDDSRRDLSVALAIAYARMGLASALLMQGRLAQARGTALEAVPLLRSCGILLAHSEVFAWLMAALGDTRLAEQLLRTADSFRDLSRTKRGPMQIQACSATRELLKRQTRSRAPDGEPIGTEALAAQLLTDALMAGETV